MSKSILSLVAVAAFASVFMSFAPANAAIVCDEDGCERAVVVPGPVLIVVDDDCGCDCCD